MRVPLEWLKEFVAITLKPAALAERLTLAGLEVTAIEGAGEAAIFEIEITPNRPDWLSIIGVAREVAAITRQRLKVPAVVPPHVRTRAAEASRAATVSITLDDKAGCPYYLGRVFTGVRVSPSPAWMQHRLAACDLRPINNVVDITNYVLLETGQPLHAFDLATLQGAMIRVRRAAAKEQVTTLEGHTHALSADMLVIADRQRPVAIAGVIGGHASAVTDGTQAVLLESAFFEPRTVRRTARALGITTDSSYRFERGIDPEGVARASQRAGTLLIELAFAQESALVEAGQRPSTRLVISLSAARVQRRLGVAVGEPTLRTSLVRLGCRVASRAATGLLQVTPPSFRRDLLHEVDLIEEIARVRGYDQLPATLPSVTLAAPQAPEAGHTQAQAARRGCCALGLSEIQTWSLLGAEALRRCRIDPQRCARLQNPLSQDHAYLRPSLLPGALTVVRRNLAQGVTGLKLFEVGRVFQGAPGDALREILVVGLVLCGEWSRDWQARLPADFFRLKGLVEALSRGSRSAPRRWQPASLAWSASGESATLIAGPQAVGEAGQVAPDLLTAWEIETPVWFAQITLDAEAAMPQTASAVLPPITMPPVKRDLSFLLDTHIPFARLESVIREAAGPLATRIELIDRYTGKQVPPGQASLTFTLEYRDPARTLTGGEADAAHQHLRETLVRELGATLR
jgi:phenylalanyl-tRNA synthetase beta chain